MNKITTKQIGGDDGYQWCVLVNGRVIINGLHKSEVRHYKAQAEQKYLTEEERKQLQAKRQLLRLRSMKRTN